MQSYKRHYSYHRPGERLPLRTQKHRSKLTIPKKALLTVALVVVGFIGIQSLIGGPGSTDGEAQSASSQPQEPPKRKVDTSTLATSLDAISKKYPYNTSVAVVDLNYGTEIQTGDTYPFIAASTTKILTALVYMSEIEKGSESLSTKIGGKTAQEQMRLMINQSDNTAWKLLNEELTKDSLSEYAKAQGVASYDATDNKVTSMDMAKLVAKLQSGKLINQEHTKLLLSWMQNTSEERFIPAAVPDSITAYHKAGYLADRVHDVAIIDNGSAPFVLVIYSKSYNNAPYDYAKAQRLYKELTTQVITTYQ